MPKSLVIVESPAKAKTMSRFLGKDYRVEASFGHIRDLPESADEVPAEIRDKPWANLGVDTEGDFKPYYVVPASKKRHVATLRAAMKDVSEVLLATDPDREGESISLHLREVLKPKVPVRRVTFHEITREAVQEAVANAHELDDNLVRAQESRRILDRLYGYTLSPVLWKKVRTGLSAGRVQSVAVRLIVEREEARRAFRSSTYWDIEAMLSADRREFNAALTRVGDERVATGRDFDSETGRLSAKGVRHLSEQDATALAGALEAHLPWEVTAVDERPGIERPAPPFTTSTLTQEASRKLGFSTSRTMRIAQRLKDGVELADGTIEGIITYHRTDSTTISEKALKESGRAIREMFGDEYYSGPRRYQTQVRNAQEAHEAIRPTDFNVTPQSVANVLDADELRLYDLIWKRTMASQMPDARVLKTTVEFTATGLDGERCVLAATGKAIEYAGFRRAYVEGSDDPDSELEAQETILPAFKPGDLVVGGGRPANAAPASLPAGLGRAMASLARLEPKKHETTPPARFTEASLIKKLEEEGIGRPSTYEPTIETILRRGYVFRQGKALVPSFTAFAVTELLRDHFEDFVDIGFTAEMEKDLDEISNGERPWLDFIREFFRGDGRQHKGLEAMARDEEQNIDYPVVDHRHRPGDRRRDPGPDREVRPVPAARGRGAGEHRVYARRPAAGRPHRRACDVAHPGEGRRAARAWRRSCDRAARLPRDRAVRPVRAARGDAGEAAEGREGGEGAKPAKGTKAEKGTKPRRAQGGEAQAGVTAARRRGGGCRFAAGAAAAQPAARARRAPGRRPGGRRERGAVGPYVKHGDEFRSLEPDDDVYTVSLERALALLAAPKQARRRQSATRTVLRELGVREDTGAAVRLLDGRYGPYVSDGKTNASLAKGADQASVGLREAVELLEARAAAGPSKKPTRRGTAGGSRRRGRPPECRSRMIHVLGGGLAGVEAAWQAASRGQPVVIHEMRPARQTEIHRTGNLAELVCSNSLRSDKLDNAVGLLKEEMRRLGSLVMRVADAVRVPAGAALAVDRERFAERVTAEVEAHPLITVVREEVTEVPEPASAGGPVIVATGPLTSAALSASIAALVGHRQLSFYDAISPIILADTIERSRVFRASRWGRSLAAGGLPTGDSAAAAAGALGPASLPADSGDYLNCPFTRDEYEAFYQALVSAERAVVHDFEKATFFEGCLPIEVMAHRGPDTLRFGPMKPVGLTDPRTGSARVRGCAVAPGQPRGRPFQPGGVPDAADVWRAGASLPDDPGTRAGRVRAVRPRPSQHVHQRAARAGGDVAGAVASGPVLRRAGVWRRGLRGVGGVGVAGGHQRGGRRRLA